MIRKNFKQLKSINELKIGLRFYYVYKNGVHNSVETISRLEWENYDKLIQAYCVGGGKKFYGIYEHNLHKFFIESKSYFKSINYKFLND